ncbi:hypothetical protein VKT23_017474 [Stygiomarasmius scandens]|uniref:Uncharacterized protein n=1 Tax=Marasmiellus scandens TaxID=2682957 RepID=A0ABR1IUV1_9AGAR
MPATRSMTQGHQSDTNDFATPTPAPRELRQQRDMHQTNAESGGRGNGRGGGRVGGRGGGRGRGHGCGIGCHTQQERTEFQFIPYVPLVSPSLEEPVIPQARNNVNLPPLPPLPLFPQRSNDEPDYTSPPVSPSDFDDIPSHDRIPLEQCLAAVAQPSLVIPRSSPHSINRGRRSSLPSQPRSNIMSNPTAVHPNPTQPDGGDVNPLTVAFIERDPDRKDQAQDCYAFYEKEENGHYSIYEPNIPEKGRYGLSTASGTLCSHLAANHFAVWVDLCDMKGFVISGAGYMDWANEHRALKGHPTQQSSAQSLDDPRQPFMQDAFVDAIAEWIIADSQSINAVKSPHLRSIFLMLREELNVKKGAEWT